MLNRREFLATAAAAAPFVSRAQARPAKRPNIILIMADDMGFSDLGCFGSEIATPNLDKLAKGGVRFTQFCNTARCCPSRASLLTGLYSHQTGIGHMVNDFNLPGYRGFLNDRCTTIAESLKGSPYHPLMVGKWHVGQDRPHWPLDRGFEHYFGLIEGADNYFRPQRQMALDNQPWKPTKPDFYMTDAFTNAAVDMIDEYGRKPDPYFLYLAYTAPHWPLHAWPQDIAKYRGKYKTKGWDQLRRERHARQLESGIVQAKWGITPRDEEVPAWDKVEDKDGEDLRMAVYAAQIDRLDQDIGRVLRKVKELGQEDNTLVMFLADNGGCAEEGIKGEQPVPAGPANSFTSYGRNWANASNTPFRLYKHWVHEGGIATPFIAHWPAVINKAGSLHHDRAHIIDLHATVLDAAGVSHPTKYQGRDVLPLEGKSLVPTFEGKQREMHETIFWEHQGNRAVRQGDYKLVSKLPDGWELYDLAADRTEMHNLASAQPDRVKSMIGLYDAWAKRCNVLPWEQIKKNPGAA